MTKPLSLKQYHGPDRPDKRLLEAGELPAPSVAIRAHCLECLDWNCADVRRCDGKLALGKCPLWEHRMGGKRGLSPSKAIREECLQCMGGSSKYVRECESTRCALWPYRLGASPRTNKKARARFAAAKPREAAVEGKNSPSDGAIEEDGAQGRGSGRCSL